MKFEKNLTGTVTRDFYFCHCRAINNELLDTYQLKSLDAVLEASISKVAFVKDEDGKLRLRVMDDEEVDYALEDNFSMREPYDRIIRCLGFTFDSGIFNT